MQIDVLFLVLMVIAVYRGARKGLIIGLISLFGWIIGLWAAIKLSDLAAEQIRQVLDIPDRWLWAAAFIAVFFLTLLAVRLIATLAEKLVNMSLMGWLNRLGGIFFYVLLYGLIFSVAIYFAEKVKLLNEETTSSSKVHAAFQPIFFTLKRVL